jgi:hypothetical protein
VSQFRIFRDGKPIFEGKQQPVSSENQPDPAALSVVGSLALGTQMQPGDYVLQITVTDDLAKEKYKSSSQFVQFELID